MRHRVIVNHRPSGITTYPAALATNYYVRLQGYAKELHLARLGRSDKQASCFDEILHIKKQLLALCGTVADVEALTKQKWSRLGFLRVLTKPVKGNHEQIYG